MSQVRMAERSISHIERSIGMSIEEKKIERLYELLEKGNLDGETSASLKWAIFELESIYCKEE